MFYSPKDGHSYSPFQDDQMSTALAAFFTCSCFCSATVSILYIWLSIFGCSGRVVAPFTPFSLAHISLRLRWTPAGSFCACLWIPNRNTFSLARQHVIRAAFPFEHTDSINRNSRAHLKHQAVLHRYVMRVNRVGGTFRGVVYVHRVQLLNILLHMFRFHNHYLLTICNISKFPILAAAVVCRRIRYNQLLCPVFVSRAIAVRSVMRCICNSMYNHFFWPISMLQMLHFGRLPNMLYDSMYIRWHMPISIYLNDR